MAAFVVERRCTRLLPRGSADLLDPRSSALLLWDLQNGLGGRAVDLERLRACWKELRDAARAAGVLIVRSKHVAPPLDVMDDTELWRIMRKQGVHRLEDLRPYMVRGSADVEFLDGFEPGDDELVIEKTTPSLFVGTPAAAWLRACGIRSIVLAGVATDIGIEFTARHAAALGFFALVVEDAVGAYTLEAQARGLACVRSFALAESTANIVAGWATAAAGSTGGGTE